MNNRIWTSALVLAFLVGVLSLLSYVAANLAYGLALRDLTLDANLRSAIAAEVLDVARSPAVKHPTKKQLAEEIVTAVRSMHGYDAVVIGDDGAVLAGNPAISTTSVLSPQGPFGAHPSGPIWLHLPGQPRPQPGSFGSPPPGGVGPRPLPGGSSPQPPQSGPWNVPLFAIRRVGGGPDGGDAWRSPASLIHVDGATVIVIRSADAINDILARGRWLAIGLIALAFVLTLLVSQRLLRSAMRPFEFVRAALTRLGGGDYSRLSVADPDDSVARELVDAYNAAAGEVAITVAQRQEVEDNIRRFVADAGHELRTPLAVITGYVDLLRHASADDNVMERRIFSEIDGQGERMRALIQNLLFLLRLDSEDPSDVKIIDAADVVQGVVDSFQSLTGDGTLTADVESGAFVKTSETELRQAIGNLIDNALKYAPGSHITARVRTQGGDVVVSVSDDGPGMSPDTRARAFERFARGDTSGSIPGSGLGLAIVARTTQRAGGSVSLQTEPGKGTRVELRFPAWKPRE